MNLLVGRSAVDNDHGIWKEIAVPTEFHANRGVVPRSATVNGEACLHLCSSLGTRRVTVIALAFDDYLHAEVVEKGLLVEAVRRPRNVVLVREVARNHGKFRVF